MHFVIAYCVETFEAKFYGGHIKKGDYHHKAYQIKSPKYGGKGYGKYGKG